MKIIDILLLSIKNLWRHKMRTFLTIMGVMIGTGAIIIMISLGLAMNRNFMTQLSQMGNLMQIQIYYYGGGMPMYDGGGKGEGMDGGGKTPPKLNDAAIAEFEKIDGVEFATPLMDLYLKASAGRYVCYMQIYGLKADAAEKLGVRLTQGTMMNADDPYGIIIGEFVKQNFYKPNPRRYEPAPPEFDLMKENLTISVDMMYAEKLQPGQTAPKYKAKPHKVHVLGIIKSGGNQFDYSVLMPLETVKTLKKEQDRFNRLNGGGRGNNTSGDGSLTYTQAIIKVKDMDRVSSVLKVVKDLGYEAYSPIQMLEDMQKQASGLQQILGGIGIMALLISAIGIANTMYMSIYERTREIGIIKVIGARLGDIRRLFMMEAIWTGIFGGLTGMLFSIGTSWLLNASSLNLFGSNQAWIPGPSGEMIRLPISYVPVWLMAAAFGFGVAASLAAGFFPARRAMRFSVMKALRQD